MSERGFFGVAVYRPKREVNVGTLWRSACSYGAAFIGTVGERYERQASDTTKTFRHTPLVHYVDLDDLIQHLPHSCPLVGVELDPRAQSLTEYVHMDRACYLLGAEDNGLPPSVLDRCHQLVQIPAPMPWSLNVAVAGSLVLHDRYVKTTVRSAAIQAVAS
jgi:tRNA G18 (ribose-2'-O)-methylase SpoU